MNHLQFWHSSCGRYGHGGAPTVLRVAHWSQQSRLLRRSDRSQRGHVARPSRVSVVPTRAFLGSPSERGAEQEEEFEYANVAVSTAPPLEKSFSQPIFSDGDDSDSGLSRMPKNVENRADDPSLQNPLERHKRMSTSWMGVIMELEGVCVEYEKNEVVMEAWKRTAAEVGKGAPLQFQLDRALGMKNDQAVQEAFNWTRNPSEARRIGAVKEEILADLLAEVAPVAFSSSLRFLQGLNGSEAETPRALVSSSPEPTVYKVLDGIPELESMFEVVVSAEDVYRGRPDPEGYLYAAQRLDRPPFRCVVVGNSNASVEAAHEVGMKCVVVAGSRPLYEMGAADLVVRSLDEVSFINLKKLFDLEQADAVPQSDIEEEDMY